MHRLMLPPALTINTTRSYPVFLLQNEWLTHLRNIYSKNCALIVDTKILQHYPIIQQNFEAIFAIPGSEISKSRHCKAYLEDQLFRAGFNRDAHLIALGGGTILDLVGYVAATFCRGVPVTYIPTSLLAMVDACIGGKTGINTEFGKNTLGTFTSPTQVIIDPTFLTTLPQHELQSGLVESLKHALIADANFFHWQAQSQASIHALDPQALHYLLLKNLQIKANIVQQDEFEHHGIRSILNFGHTIGHALEMSSNYQLTHGAAVACGIVTENFIAERLGILMPEISYKIGQTLLQLASLIPVSATYLKPDAILQAIMFDKKQRDQSCYSVLLQTIGQVYIDPDHHYTVHLARDLLQEAIMWLQHQNNHGFQQFQ